jgi:hypothetical protein
LCSWIFHEFRKMQYFQYIVSFAVWFAKVKIICKFKEDARSRRFL